MKVAVIGAGAAGLVCARELLREGLQPTVFEASSAVGGTWVYDPRPSRHGAMYASLRTNLPTDVMAFRDVPFEGLSETRRFPGHAAIRAYLERFVVDFELEPHIRFGTAVRRVSREGGGFLVEAEGGGFFDAVAVCTGHYHRPFRPDLPGLEGFAGRVSHSHDYRVPAPYRGRRVALFGAKSSGIDLSGELAAVADAVWLSGRAVNASAARRGVQICAPIVRARGADLELADGGWLRDVDDLLLCTGYDYAFPFLDDPELVTLEAKWVHPLWLDVVCVRAPGLAFIGLPFQVVPFPLMELQSRLFAQLLSGRLPRPSEAQMLAEHTREVEAREAEGTARRHFFRYGARQFEVLDDLARRVGATPMPPEFRARYEETSAARAADPDGYRDALDPHP